MIPRTLAKNNFDGADMEIRHALDIRAPQATISGQTPTNTGFSFGPSMLPADQLNGDRSGLAKSILEYLFLAIALIIVTSMILRRLTALKRTNQPYRSFFNMNGNYPTTSPNRGLLSFPRATGLHPVNPDARRPYPPYPNPHLAGFPAAYLGHSIRRTHAQDIDASGRGIGNSTDLDVDGELGDKDALPAYDNYGGPPKYIELELHSRLFGVGNCRHPPVDEPTSRVSESVDILTHEGDGQGQMSLNPSRSANLDPRRSPPTHAMNEASGEDTGGITVHPPNS
ncbi:hypothetical protein BDZ97DRAFT_1919917 [Flammula alnicola]|nr:hypothetical protein BDZ97DRAFT_1919917 [Flammula alnicola]